MKIYFYILGVNLVFALLLIFPNSVIAKVRGVTSDTIKIGSMAAITGPDADVYGGVVPGWRTYINQINDSGGIHGRKIKFLVEDDRFTIPIALSSFKKLVYRDNIFAFSWAASGAGHTHAIIPLVEKEKIPLIAGTNNLSYFIPARKYIFTTLPSYEDQVKILFNYFRNDLKLKRSKIALLYMDSASSRPVLQLVRKFTKKYKYPLKELVIPLGGLDMTSQALLLKRDKSDYVIIHGYVGNTAAVLRDAKRYKLKSQFIAMQYGFVRKTIEIARSAGEGLMGINAFGSYMDNSPGMIKMREIDKKYHPDVNYRDRNYVQGWLCSMILCEGLKNAGRNLNEDNLISGWEKIKNLDTQGICGVVDLGPNDHRTTKSSRVYKVDMKKLSFIPVTGWRNPK
ncbi:MAG: ABC transporter substrate-binding protein [Spirochaetota bacterium]|nr:ABC transporter substrate-binding protein [Spirochaetota bacterium]